MRVLGASIQNFRGIRSADIRFPKHALLVGPNNVCKTTILEALDLVLGPDRARGPDAITEHDFFRGSYYDVVMSPDEQDGAPEEVEGEMAEEAEVPGIRITVTLGYLDDANRTRFRGHLEPWSHEEFRPVEPEELDELKLTPDDYVLRVGFRGWYDPEEDDFATETFFLNPAHPSGDRDSCGRRSKQAIGFLYLRSFRTARRAASMERGSLLETLLRARSSETQVWESLIRGLQSMGSVLEGNQQLRGALDAIEERIQELIPLASGKQTSGLQVGRLTRRHLRETMTYFLASRDSDHLLPFDRLGSGTSNVLVLALLGAIADAKENVIFAMEEPEIALPPHTQRAIVQKLRRESAQAIVTSHSPYIAEVFLPDDLAVVRRSETGDVISQIAQADSPVKEKALRRDFRTRFAEGMLARSITLVEGPTELWALPSAVDVLAKVPGTAFRPPELDGMVFLPADGTGEIPKLCGYFGQLGIPTHVFCDKIDVAEETEILAAADSLFQHPHAGFEALMARELQLDVLKRLVRASSGWPDYPHHLGPLADEAPETDWRARCEKLLKMRKGEAWAARFLSQCTSDEIPESVIAGLAHLRRELGHPPLPTTDPLAEVFRHADGSAVHNKAQADDVERGGEEASSDSSSEAANHE